MRKKGIIIVSIAALLSSLYILVFASYCKLPNNLTTIYDMLTMKGASSKISKKLVATSKQVQEMNISYDETCVTIIGIVYGETLDEKALVTRADEMSYALSHEDDCSKVCTMSHINNATIEVATKDDEKIAIVQYDDGENSYIFNIKNQKDIGHNTYYELKITGIRNTVHLDQMKGHAQALFDKWHVETKETFYFKGVLSGERIAQYPFIKEQMMQHLDAVQTNAYVDDINESTCAYYAYCPYIASYYREQNGFKTNMQIAFHYDDVANQTEVIVAFPFYNEVF